jgi:hypothetical protein
MTLDRPLWNGRACPEKWPADFPRRAQHAHRPTILAEHLIGSDDFALPLSELAVRYPAPRTGQSGMTGGPLHSICRSAVL